MIYEREVIGSNSTLESRYIATINLIVAFCLAEPSKTVNRVMYVYTLAVKHD